MTTRARHLRMAIAAVLAATTAVAVAALPAAGDDVDLSGTSAGAPTGVQTLDTSVPTTTSVDPLGGVTSDEVPGGVGGLLEENGILAPPPEEDPGATEPAPEPTEPTTEAGTQTETSPSGATSGPAPAGNTGTGSAAPATDPFASLPNIGDDQPTTADGSPAFDGMGMIHAVEGDPFAAWGTGYVPTWGSRSTSSIVELLGPGATPEQVAKVLAPFPVAGPASYSDDWGAPRFTPAFHAHAGTDVFAARGTPVIASSDGTITRLAVGTAIGGTTVQLSTADGTYFYYAHLNAHAPGLAVGQVVAQGSVLGYVGTSGNAEGTPPHLHYEIHPQGGAAVPPVPYLDRWLADAMARATGFAGAADPVAAEQFLANAAATRTPVVPIVPAANIGPLEIEPVADLQDPSGALVLIGAAAIALAWRRRRGMAQIATGRIHRRGLPRALSIPDTPAALLAAREPRSFRLMPVRTPHLPTAPAPVATPALASRLGGQP